MQKRTGLLFLLVVILLTVTTAWAQEYRGSIAGQVTDTSGAVIPGVQVTATNVATNNVSTTVSNDDGTYKITYLPPGKYTLIVELSGFKKHVREGIEVRVGDQLALDIQLEVGEIEQIVSVSAQAPLLQSSSASVGQVIDQRRISELPLSDGNPFVLSRLAPGVTYTGDLKFSRPFDNAGSSAIVVDGATGGNEFTLDGSPNMASGRRVAFVPPADVVQEFKVETVSFDAQQGHTAGATVNVALKGGTNNFHGTLYEFVRNDILSGNDFFLNRANPPADKNKDGKADRAPLRYNRYGGTAGGPIWIPKIYNGRSRSFFFFGYEGIKDQFPEPGLFTVPTDAQRNGDFSALLPGIVIYDPLTAVAVSGGRIQRTPFSGNLIPSNRISPVAKEYLKFYPRPNQPGDSQGRNNFIGPNGRGDDFHSETYRFDHTLTERQQMFFRFSHNNRREFRGNWTGVVNGIRPTGNFLFRINNGGTFDHVYTLSPRTILNYRVGFSRFNEPNIRQHEGAFNPATLGFSASTAALFGGASYFPRFEINNFSALGDSVGGATTHNIYSFQPTLTRLFGNHSLRAGYDLRSYRENSFGPGHQAGRYDFDTNFTRGPLDNATGFVGQGLAAFMLGQPTGGLIDRNASRANQTLYHGVFIQDDWKITDKLTLNLGVRYEYEEATTERFDRNVRGFDSSSASPIEAAVKAAYAATPIPEISPANFKVRGGLMFAGSDNRQFWEPDNDNIQPRIGIAYMLGQHTVLRGGWAVYTVPGIIDGVNQSGFSQATNIVPTLNSGLTFRASSFDPFPDGVANPPGASQGLATFLGRGIGFVPLERQNPQSQRWEIGVQHELPSNWLVEMAYVGNRGYDMVVGTNILNAIPRQYLSTRTDARDTTVINFLSANVTNPFRGLVPGTGLDGSTVQRQQLLRPFPQFTSIGGQTNDGKSIYHSGQLRVERRFAKGYTILTSYTWSKFLEQASFRNETDTEYEKRIQENDAPHRLVASGIYELPFGRGRMLGSNWNGWLDGVLGGWQFQGIWQGQSGRPIGLGNLVYFGDPTKLRVNPKNINRTFDTSGFFYVDAAVQTNGVLDPVKQRNDQRIRLANNIRTFPSRLPGFRGQGLNLWDLSLIKNVAISESVKVQLRGEFLNAINHPQFENPNVDPTSSNFGNITGQNNLPRNVQLGIKIVF
ncbi:MAG: TonB-dependent receptor [Acidobacteriota bacterium]